MNVDEKYKENALNESGYIYVTLFKRTIQSTSSLPFQFAPARGLKCGKAQPGTPDSGKDSCADPIGALQLESGVRTRGYSSKWGLYDVGLGPSG